MKYPIYILSKGRADSCLTAELLLNEDLEFKIFVESEEASAYARRYGSDRLVVMPFNNLKQGATPARNFIKDYSRERGEARHWQIDDNIKGVYRYSHGKGVKCRVGYALLHIEYFVDRYSNVAIAGITNKGFAFSKTKPYQTNIQVYCWVLVDNNTPFRWRGIGAEDTDYSLQVVNAGLCTVLFNCFAIDKAASGSMKGGNQDVVYTEDGRLRRAKQLQEFWPNLDIKITERWGRTFQDLNRVWKNFTTPLAPKSGVITDHWAGMPEYVSRKDSVHEHQGVR